MSKKCSTDQRFIRKRNTYLWKRHTVILSDRTLKKWALYMLEIVFLNKFCFQKRLHGVFGQEFIKSILKFIMTYTSVSWNLKCDEPEVTWFDQAQQNIYCWHTGRNCFNLFQILFSANTADTDPGVSGVSKDQKFYENFKNTHCQVDHPAKIE